jgi:hypothetical protein
MPFQIKASVGVSSIAVIEWLGSTDKKTGRELADQLDMWTAALRPDVRVKYVEVADEQDFLGAIEACRGDVDDGGVPLVHIETHGDDSGLGPRGARGVNWPEFEVPRARVMRF